MRTFRSTPRRLGNRAATATAVAVAATGLSLLTAPVVAQAGTTTGVDDVFRPQLVTVDTPSRQDKERLQSLGLDLTEHAGHDYVEVLLHTPADLARLTASKFTYDVRIPDLVARGVEIALTVPVFQLAPFSELG